MKLKQISAQGFLLQEQPEIICVSLPGPWLLQHTTPSWRYDDPEEGFQRMVSTKRATEIALAVLDQHRTFPNAIVLATDADSIAADAGEVLIPENVQFLVVDGQHRLWAQRHSQYEAPYACIVHTGLSPEEMANLFLEINDNQKRVPASLRWDLIRLIRPDDDQQRLAAVEMVYLLATEEESPFYQRIDLTGEQSELQIKQASLAPEFSTLLSRRSPLAALSFIQQHQVILQYSVSIQQIDADRWGSRDSAFFKARVLRSMFRLLADLARTMDQNKLANVTVDDFLPYLRKIDEQKLDPDYIRSMQGSAGIRQIYLQIRDEVFSGG
ncbi:MAG: DGQHR domain-containing protein [Chloroflexota bacterium]|nr:DGQHR domain-containing protein [Chloroflexota bacterium]MDE2959160.1 DGQHR domain-containing protein [Chloroflexota bacterium]